MSLALSPSARTAFLPRRKISWRRKSAYSLVIFLLLALGAELVLRLLDPEILRYVHGVRQVHVYPGWNFVDLRPQAKAQLALTRADGKDFLRFTITTDALGCRSLGPLEPAPDAGGRKIIHCIGDSFTMGWGVEDAQSYPAALARLLGDPYRVVNLGVDGFGLLAAMEKSNRLAAKPDYIFYLFCFNDFEDDTLTLQVQNRLGVHHALLQGVDFARRHTYLANVPFALKWAWHFRHRSESLGEQPEPGLAADEMRADIVRQAAKTSPLANSTTAALRKLADQCRSTGTRLLVVLCDAQPASAAMVRFCQDQGIEHQIIPLTSSRFRIPGDGHFNAEGNRRLAEVLAQEYFAAVERDSTDD